MKRIFRVSAVAFLLTLCGCGLNVMMPWSAKEVSVAEVLQQKKGDKVYLRSNIWYEDAKSISCMNIQKGKRLAFGTEVEPMASDDLKLRFKDKQGVEYAVVYDPSMMGRSMRTFIKNFLTVEPPDKLLEKISPEKRKAIESGKVIRGMSRQEVMLSWGVPVLSRTPQLQNATWIYWRAPEDTVRLVFRGDKVRNIYRFNPEKKEVEVK